MDYRKRALKILPWVCARCAREFTGKNLRQLTVHHKDHDHTNNPADGSNWELLCVYCHDDEHSRKETAEAYGKPSTGRRAGRGSFRAFEGLGQLLGAEATADEDDGAVIADEDDAAENGAPEDRAPRGGEPPARSETPADRDFWGDDS